MSGCALFILLQCNLMVVGTRIPVNIDDIVVYAKIAYKISAGSAAKLGQFPWAVALTLSESDDYNFCGGVIISKRHILTAAHCVLDFASYRIPCTSGILLDDIFQIRIRYGGICLRTYSPPCEGRLSSTAGVRKIAFNKRFLDEKCIHGFDFAIIEVDIDLTVNLPKVQNIKPWNPFSPEGFMLAKYSRTFQFAEFDSATSAICLPNENFNLSDAQDLFDYGFGENEKGEKMSGLSYGSAKIISVSKSRDFLRVGPIFEPNPRVGPLHGICTGDSGAGLQGFFKHRAYLLGMHSFGPRFCYDGAPFTVTDSRPYADLICQLTGICYQSNYSL